MTLSRLLRAALVGAALLGPATAGLCRAGGGGGFHPGGSGGSGGSHDSGGGDGDGRLAFVLIEDMLMLTVRHPLVGIPIDIVIVLVVVAVYRQQSQARNSVGQAAGEEDFRPERQHDPARDGLDALKAHDPDFNENTFARRVADAFVAIQVEWSERRLDRVRSLTTDGVRERFQILLDTERDRGIINVTRDVAVTGVGLVDVQSDQAYDTVQVRVDASAVDYYVRLGTDELVYGSQAPEAFAEYWSFLRRRGAKSAAGKGLMEGHCPSCGAGLTLTDRGECSYCKAVVNTGAFDWVLAEITQTSVADGKGRLVRGLDVLAARDPAFNVQYIEDRVSLMFWRVRRAEFCATTTPLVQISTPEFLQARRARYEAPGPKGVRRFACDAAVGAIDLVAVEPSRGAGDPDRLHVRVKWSGREVQSGLPAFIPPNFEACQFCDQEYVLTRDPEARTPAGQDLRTNRCQACGAPQTADAGATCASCGTPLNSGTLDWLLSEVRPFTGAMMAAPHAPGARTG